MSERPTYSVPDDLVELEDLPEFAIAEGEPDPRGWPVLTKEGEPAGEIRGLMASPSAGKVYLAIVATRGIPSRWIAIPLATLEFDDVQRKALSPFPPEAFRGAPEWRETARDFQRHVDYWCGWPGAQAACGWPRLRRAA